MVQAIKCKAEVLSSKKVNTREWAAWNNLQLPPPDDFHIFGQVQVPNPGVDLMLKPRNPQGINPKILLMDLIQVQRPGLWPQIVVWKEARHDEILSHDGYDQAEIYFENSLIESLDVRDIE